MPSDLLAESPHIPWSQIVGMRNILIHDYSEMNLPTIWLTIERDLPPLRTAVEQMLAEAVPPQAA